MTTAPLRLAVAGAWGYIGHKVVDAAVALGLEVWALDPGPVPDDVDPRRVQIIKDEDEFYRLPAHLFHLALHPQHRATAFSRLLARADANQLTVLCEKPMAAPETPEECARIIAAGAQSPALVLYDFVELYDPLTHRIVDYLRGFDRLEVTEILLQRSKDREDPARSRNYKSMVHIQYQESVHCLAFLLNLVGRLAGSVPEALAPGLRVRASSRPYAPPNPPAYPYVVDGQCTWDIECGPLAIHGCTDFKSGAEFTKRKVIRGVGDGQAFELEADHFEGRKYLKINGVDQHYPATACSYRSILTTLSEWLARPGRQSLRQGVYPHPEFAWLTYQLSSVLWRSCFSGTPIRLASAAALTAFDAGFAAAAKGFARYP
jgi:predicted dehydrogenase